MKKLIFILLFVPFLLGGQTPEPLVDLSEYHDYNRLFEMADKNFTDITTGVYTMPAIKVDSITTDALYYSNTYWDDLKAPFSSTRRGALSKPDFDYDNVGLLFPQNDTSEIVYAVMQFSHSRKAGSDISPHIHWQQMNGNDVVWTLQYKWFDNGSVPPTTWTQLIEDSDIFTYTSGNLLQITDFPMVDGSGITGVSSIFLVKVWRDDNVDGGAGGGDVLGFEFDVHYQKDQPASAEEYSK